MKFRNLFILMVALMSLAGLDYRFDDYYHVKDIHTAQDSVSLTSSVFKKYYTQYATWASPPLVKVCKHAPVTKREVEEAVLWWENRGYAFDGIVYGAPCINNRLPGHIIIDIHNQASFPNNRNDLGTTFTHVKDGTDDIYAASIYLLQVRERVLVHELGHALGWDHIQRIGHVMNRTWSHGGWKDDHLKRQCSTSYSRLRP